MSTRNGASASCDGRSAASAVPDATWPLRKAGVRPATFRSVQAEAMSYDAAALRRPRAPSDNERGYLAHDTFRRTPGARALGWTALGLVFALRRLRPSGTGGRTSSPPSRNGGPGASWPRSSSGSMSVALVRQATPTANPSAPHPERAGNSGLHVSSGGVTALVGVGTWRAAYDPQTLVNALRGMFLWSWLVYWLILGAWQAHQVL